jgi:hypothetical protein
MPRRPDVKRVLVIACVLYALLWQGYWPGKAAAQVGAQLVNDPGVIAQIINQITQTVELVQQGIAHLTALSNLGTIGVILAHVQAMMETAQDIMDDIAAISRDWNALVADDQLPTTAVQLFEWNSRASGLMLRGTQRAFAAMSLLHGVLQLLADAQRLFALIQSLGGQLASLQLIAGQMVTLVNETIRAETLMASYHQAMLSPVIVEAVNERAAEFLARERLQDFGVVGPHLDLR